MNIEYEVKILEIDVEKIIKKLNYLNAEYIWEFLQKRLVYDFSPIDENKWIRLRQNWEKAYLTIKEITNDSISWTKELETEVSDFETTDKILNKLWYTHKAFQENKRISYILDWANIELDFWPLIPPYLEIEGKNEEHVISVLSKLGFDISDTTSINTKKVYSKYWINLDDIKELKF